MRWSGRRRSAGRSSRTGHTPRTPCPWQGPRCSGGRSVRRATPRPPMPCRSCASRGRARQVGFVKRPLDAPRLGRARVIGLQAHPGRDRRVATRVESEPDDDHVRPVPPGQEPSHRTRPPRDVPVMCPQHHLGAGGAVPENPVDILRHAAVAVIAGGGERRDRLDDDPRRCGSPNRPTRRRNPGRAGHGPFPGASTTSDTAAASFPVSARAASLRACPSPAPSSF